MLRAVEMLPIRQRDRNLCPSVHSVREAFNIIHAGIGANRLEVIRKALALD